MVYFKLPRRCMCEKKKKLNPEGLFLLPIIYEIKIARDLFYCNYDKRFGVW